MALPSHIEVSEIVVVTECNGIMQSVRLALGFVCRKCGFSAEMEDFASHDCADGEHWRYNRIAESDNAC